MTNQEIFDKAVAGLASQKFRRSMRSDGTTCAYRGEDGARCALGWGIPDENYSVEFEENAVSTYNAFDTSNVENQRICRRIVEAAGAEFNAPTVQFLGDLQRAHDRSYILKYEDGLRIEQDAPNDMRKRLVKVAVDYGLTLPEVLRG